MKKFLSLATLGLVLLSSCVKGFDGMEPEPTPTPDPSPSSGVTEEDIYSSKLRENLRSSVFNRARLDYHNQGIS